LQEGQWKDALTTEEGKGQENARPGTRGVEGQRTAGREEVSRESLKTRNSRCSKRRKKKRREGVRGGSDIVEPKETPVEKGD